MLLVVTLFVVVVVVALEPCLRSRLESNSATLSCSGDGRCRASTVRVLEYLSSCFLTECAQVPSYTVRAPVHETSPRRIPMLSTRTSTGTGPELP
ncbi:hypothetical protein HOY80DRAFT_940319 [Tuber brumale]|nr:hypothetical protein HOY80DRAFT_940319 [Tuber brumale]